MWYKNADKQQAGKLGLSACYGLPLVDSVNIPTDLFEVKFQNRILCAYSYDNYYSTKLLKIAFM